MWWAFKYGQLAISIRIMLEALGHVQPPTPLKTDNSITHGFTHDNMQQKRSIILRHALSLVARQRNTESNEGVLGERSKQ